jgi:transmembrane sensor
MDAKLPDRTLQEAARWQARLHAENCSESDRQAFREWQDSRSDRARAASVAQSVLDGVDQLTRQSRLQALADEAFAEHAHADVRGPRKLAWVGAMAASVMLGVFAFKFYSATFFAVQPMAYETSSSERREVQLSDGSTIEMDAGTRLNVKITADERVVELLAGRAVFAVAHDSARPFSVDAAGARTTALGTRFQVQRQEKQVVVTLAEGSVAVTPDIAGGTAMADAWRERLMPGEQLTINQFTAARDKTVVDPAVVTSWTQGRHIFRATPLGEAVEEVNRYAAKKVRLGDPALAELRVGGSFIAGDSEQIVAAFAAVLPVRIVQGGNDEIILFRSHDSPLN